MSEEQAKNPGPPIVDDQNTKADNKTQTPGPPIVDDQNAMSGDAKCPFLNGARKHTVGGAQVNANWWPNQLNLKILHQHSALSNPMGEGIQLRRGVQEPGSGCRDQGPA